MDIVNLLIKHIFKPLKTPLILPFGKGGESGGVTFAMTKHFNKKAEQEKRRLLRNSMTFCEKLVWMFLRKKQYGYRFLRQYSIDQFVVDFYSPKLKLAVEIDGDVHNVPEQMDYDKDRQDYIEKFGITFVRITNEELLGNPNKAFAKIENAIKLLQQK